MLDITGPYFDVVAKETGMPLFKRRRPANVQAALEEFHKQVVVIAVEKARGVLSGKGSLPLPEPGRPARSIGELLDQSSTEVAQKMVQSALKEVGVKAGAALNFN